MLNRPRHEEFELFLDWLRTTIIERRIDALLVAGDVFDTTTPGPRAQRLYYEFLASLQGTCCRHIVVIGGNHDSPRLLDAPRSLLETLHVHVVGGVEANEDGATNFDREVIVLEDGDGRPEAVVCAVPYLRERDISWAMADDSAGDKESRLIGAIRDHYAAVAAKAEALREEIRKCFQIVVPLLGMGHLFAVGGVENAVIAENSETYGENVRDLYVGSLGAVRRVDFPEVFDYVALGHLHLPLCVEGSELFRYSGSPIPMGFGESGKPKIVLEIEFTKSQSTAKPSVAKIEVPCFRRLVSLKGDAKSLQQSVRSLEKSLLSTWVELFFQESHDVFELGRRVTEWTKGLPVEVLRFTVELPVPAESSQRSPTIELLDEIAILELCLDVADVSVDLRDPYRRCYREILFAMQQEEPAEE